MFDCEISDLRNSNIVLFKDSLKDKKYFKNVNKYFWMVRCLGRDFNDDCTEFFTSFKNFTVSCNCELFLSFQIKVYKFGTFPNFNL